MSQVMLIDFLRNVRRFSSITSWTSAIQLLLAENLPGVMSIHLSSISRTIWFRTGTSDLKCIEKVFINGEYAIPYDVSPSTIIDVGANIGTASLYFASKYPNAIIYAIEPETSNFDLLTRNCSRSKNIVLVQAALWYEEARLNLVDASAEKWSFSVEPGTDPEMAVESLTMNELFSRFGFEYIDILKLDIEGAEAEIFSSPETQWLEKVGTIIIELHDRYKARCAQSFYSALYGRQFSQEICGENIVIRLLKE